MKLKPGDVIELDKFIEGKIALFVGDVKVAQGALVVQDDALFIRIEEIVCKA